MTLFSKRQYDWLAAFAGECISEESWHLLAGKLKLDNSAFNYDRFIDACDKANRADIARKHRQYGS